MAGTLNNRRTIYTKKLIREQFFLLLEDNELDKITIKRLCELCDINRGTFYRYYKDIYDLYNQIEDELLNEIMSHIDIGNNKKEWLSQVLDIIKENKGIVNMIVQKKNNKNLLTRLLIDIRPEAFEEIKTYYAKSSNDEIDLHLTFYIQGSVGLILQWLQEYPHIDSKDISKLLLDNFINLRV